MDDRVILTMLVELRLGVNLSRQLDARSALTLFETHEAIRQTQELIHRSDRLIASLSVILCYQVPAKTEWTASTGPLAA